jgi:hypothetical protein
MLERETVGRGEVGEKERGRKRGGWGVEEKSRSREEE